MYEILNMIYPYDVHNDICTRYSICQKVGCQKKLDIHM